MGDLLSDPAFKDTLSVILNFISLIVVAVITGWFSLAQYRKKKKTDEEQRAINAEKLLEKERQQQEHDKLHAEIEKCVQLVEQTQKSVQRLDSSVTEMDRKMTYMDKRITQRLNSAESNIKKLIDMQTQITAKYTAMIKTTRENTAATNRLMVLENLNMQFTRSTSRLVVLISDAVAQDAPEPEKSRIEKTIAEHREEEDHVFDVLSNPVQSKYLKDYTEDLTFIPQIPDFDQLSNANGDDDKN